MDDTMGSYPGRAGRRARERAGARPGGRLRAYLRSRTADHWIMFAAGLVLGVVLG